MTHAFNHPYNPRTEYIESEGGGREGLAGKGRGRGWNIDEFYTVLFYFLFYLFFSSPISISIFFLFYSSLFEEGQMARKSEKGNGKWQRYNKAIKGNEKNRKD